MSEMLGQDAGQVKAGLRMLFVTPVLPGPTTGGRTRPFNLIQRLASRHEVSVISFVQPFERLSLPDLERMCRDLTLIDLEAPRRLGVWRNRLQGWSRILFSVRPLYAHTFPVRRMRQPLRDLLRSHKYDLAIFETLFLVELVNELGSLPRVLVEQNVESDVARRSFARAMRRIHAVRDWVTWRRLRAFERYWLRQFPVCVAVSERDAALLREMSPATEVYVVPNGVDCQAFSPQGEARESETLLFFGVLSYWPNAEGLVWFCEHVLPVVRRRNPGAVLEIVGPDPLPQVQALAQLPGVRLTGFVEDIRPALWRATATVVPLHVGGGTRLKIVEALAAGCPVISTSLGAEGLALTPGEHLLIADTPEEFARAICCALDSAELRRRLAEAGQQVARERYDWGRIALMFEQACLRAVELGRAGVARFG